MNTTQELWLEKINTLREKSRLAWEEVTTAEAVAIEARLKAADLNKKWLQAYKDHQAALKEHLDGVYCVAP